MNIKILYAYLIFSAMIGVLNIINFISISINVKRNYEDKINENKKAGLFETSVVILRLFLASFVPILNISFLYCFFNPKLVLDRIDKAIKKENE